MKHIIGNHAKAAWLGVAAMAVLISGCATPEQHSYNKDFNENLTTKPKYYIEDVNDTHFKITVDQGVPSTEANRLIDVKTAASAVARQEGQQRGWDKWHLDYIQEKDQGWMHVVVAEVTRETHVDQ